VDEFFGGEGAQLELAGVCGAIAESNLSILKADASASADAGPARLAPTNGILAGKVWLINRAVGGRLHAVVGRAFGGQSL